MQPTISDTSVPVIEDTIVPLPETMELPNFEDQIKQKWAHDKLVSATMTAQFTETSIGKPQLEVTLDCNGAQQKFWARIGETRSNWVLSRFTLPLVNLVKLAQNAPCYDFGTELQQETLMQYLNHPWIRSKMEEGIEVRVVTTVRNGYDAQGNSKRTTSCEFIHHNDDGSDKAFEAIKAIQQKDSVASAQAVNKAIASNQVSLKDLM